MVAKPLCPLYKNIIKHLDRARYPELRYYISSRTVLFSWMDKFLNEKDLLSLPPEDQNRDDMAKTTNEQLKEKDAEIKRLRKALELEKLRSKAFSTMIDLAEETFNIPVRKKSGTKQ